MRSSSWCRAQAIVLALFAAGHTLGTAVPRARYGAAQTAVIAAMQVSRFPIMGFERSYWDFYRGFALIISVLLAVLAILAWQLSAIARRDARAAMPQAFTLLFASLPLLALSAKFFFAGPIGMSVAEVAGAAATVWMLSREASAATHGAGIDHRLTSDAAD